MEPTSESRTEQRLLDASLVLLVVYNAVFVADILMDAIPDNAASRTMDFIDARRGWITLFEAIAAAALFIDLVVRFDQYTTRRNWRVTGVAIAGAGFVFKAFTYYLNSSYLE